VYANTLTEPGLSAGDHPLQFRFTFSRVNFALRFSAVFSVRQAMIVFLRKRRDASKCAREFTPTQMRTAVVPPRRAITVLVALGVLGVAAACGGGAIKLTPAPTLPPPAPAPVLPITLEPVIARWTIPAVVPFTRYLSEVSAALERDSAGRVLTERVDTRALITLQGRRDTLGAFRGSGVVDSFTVRGLESALAPDQGETKPRTTVPVLVDPPIAVLFDAAFDTRNLRVAVKPPLANECDRPETGATNLVRDLLVRLPARLTVGQLWQDSTFSFVCRLGIPITSRTKSSYSVERADKVQGGIELIVRRISELQLNGELKSTWRTMTVSATGRTTHTIRVDATTGVVRSVESDGLLTIKLNDTSRRDGSGAQEIRQMTQGRITLRP